MTPTQYRLLSLPLTELLASSVPDIYMEKRTVLQDVRHLGGRQDEHHMGCRIGFDRLTAISHLIE